MKDGTYIAIIIKILIVVIGLAAIGFWIYVLITYGGKPVTEIPAWAIWLLMPKR